MMRIAVVTPQQLLGEWADKVQECTAHLELYAVEEPPLCVQLEPFLLKMEKAAWQQEYATVFRALPPTNTSWARNNHHCSGRKQPRRDGNTRHKRTK